MANYSEQQNKASFLALFCLSECIVMLIETVAIATLNTLTIITRLKEHSLHQRGTYLAINQTVVAWRQCEHPVGFWEAIVTFARSILLETNNLCSSLLC